MDIYWYGQSFFKIKGKSASILIDPFSADATGLKLPKDLEAQIVLSTHSHPDHNNIAAVTGDPLVITGSGEYERSGVSIVGIPSFHDNQKGAERGKNTIYHIIIDGVNILHLGDLGHPLEEAQTSQIDNVDILMVPVGGVYTINGTEGSKVVADLEAKVVIPMHYQIEGLKYELEGVENFLKAMGVENISPQPKLSITKDKLLEDTQIVVLSKT